MNRQNTAGERHYGIASRFRQSRHANPSLSRLQVSKLYLLDAWETLADYDYLAGVGMCTVQRFNLLHDR